MATRGDALHAPHAAMHGCLGDASWAPPRCRMSFNAPARRTFTHIEASEYVDEPEVLAAKVALLAGLVRRAKACVAFTGAGISTSAGIDDYASKGEAAAGRPAARDWKEAAPTLAHRVLAGLYHRGLLHHWVQQNHDSLPQKAGYPQHALNEIHGSLHDPSNPVVPYEGSLRGDLYALFEHWQAKSDLVLALGTSMSGFNVDSLAEAAADRRAAGRGLGLVIANLQRTQYDGLAALRIFAPLDEVAAQLAEALAVEPLRPRAPELAPGALVEPDVVRVPFGAKGERCARGALLDLRKGQRLRLTQGPYAGDVGTVVEKRGGAYRLRFEESVNPTFQAKRAPFSLWLGGWWLEELTHGRVSPGALAPLVNTGERVEVRELAPPWRRAPAGRARAEPHSPVSPSRRSSWRQTERGWTRA